LTALNVHTSRPAAIQVRVTGRDVLRFDILHPILIQLAHNRPVIIGGGIGFENNVEFLSRTDLNGLLRIDRTQPRSSQEKKWNDPNPL